MREPSTVRSLGVLGLTACLAVALAAAADERKTPTLDELCRTTRCAPARPIEILLLAGRAVTVEVPRHPIVVDNNIHVMPGDRLYVEVEAGTGKRPRLRAVDAITKPTTTLTLELSQHNESGKPATFLHVKNPLAKVVKYRGMIVVYGRDDLRPTNVCPVLPGKESFEIWPDPLLQVVMTNVELLDPPADGKVTCE